MTKQGIAAVNDTGVAILSRNIESELIKEITYDAFESKAFGIAYTSERKYILFTPNTSSSEYPTTAWVYNQFTGAWTKWNFSCTAGLVNSADDKLYLGSKGYSSSAEWIYRENKTFTADDYFDDAFQVRIDEVVSTYVVKISGTFKSYATVGWTIRQVMYATQETLTAKITAVDYDTDEITVDTALDWSTDYVNEVNLYKPIECKIKWCPQTCENPGILKHFRDLTVLFRQHEDADVQIGFETNLRPDYEEVEYEVRDMDNYGDFGWGTVEWQALDSTYVQMIRTLIPRNKARAHWISIKVSGANAFAPFSIVGASMQFINVSERATNDG
jgi:hypothetical protein